jgi:small subunit ribosomal protein S16
MVKIRLRRIGKKGQPSYRVVVTDSRSPRDGRFIENIGSYDPMREPSFVEINGPRALEWIGKGAQPTQAVTRLLEIAGVVARQESPKAGARAGATS